VSIRDPGDSRVSARQLAEVQQRVLSNPGNSEFSQPVNPGAAVNRGTERSSTAEEHRRMVDFAAAKIRSAMDGA
jgi:hypothetical protein